MINPETKKRGTRLSPEQLRGVESPATQTLVPISLGDSATWWSHDNILIGGIKVNSIKRVENGVHRSLIGFIPTLIPRSWEGNDFAVVTEYETETEGADFRFRLFYGCGDPSDLRLGETPPIQGKSDGKQRLTFKLNPKFLQRNELFRCTLDVSRVSPDPVLVYSSWLEVGVD